MKKLVVIAASLLLSSVAHAGSIEFVMENYPPYSFREDGKYKGASVEQVEIMMKATGMDYTMEMMPWARALMLAETQPMHCVVNAAHNADRHPKFKWIEPILTDRMILIRKAGSPVNPATLEDAKRFVIGTQRDDFTADILKAQHFPKIDLAPDFDLTLRKLMLGRIDLMPISQKYYDKLKRQGAEVEYTLLLSEQIYSIACHKSVHDADIAKMQASLDALIANGTQDALMKKYGLDIDSQ